LAHDFEKRLAAARLAGELRAHFQRAYPELPSDYDSLERAGQRAMGKMVEQGVHLKIDAEDEFTRNSARGELIQRMADELGGRQGLTEILRKGQSKAGLY
jgi:hypothetical protein